MSQWCNVASSCHWHSVLSCTLPGAGAHCCAADVCDEGAVRHAGRELRAGAVQGRPNTHGEDCNAMDVPQWPDLTTPLRAPPCAAHCVCRSRSWHSHGLLGWDPSTVHTCDHVLLQMKALCEVPRNGLQLLPYYARITATLSRVFPDIGQGDFAPRRPGCQPAAASTAATSCVPPLLLPDCERGKEFAHRLTGAEHHLESEFRLLQRRRDVVGRNAEARLGNVRFLGELVKFRLIPFGAVLSRLKVRLGPTSLRMPAGNMMTLRLDILPHAKVWTWCPIDGRIAMWCMVWDASDLLLCARSCCWTTSLATTLRRRRRCWTRRGASCTARPRRTSVWPPWPRCTQLCFCGTYPDQRVWLSGMQPSCMTGSREFPEHKGLSRLLHDFSGIPINQVCWPSR